MRATRLDQTRIRSYHYRGIRRVCSLEARNDRSGRVQVSDTGSAIGARRCGHRPRDPHRPGFGHLFCRLLELSRRRVRTPDTRPRAAQRRARRRDAAHGKRDVREHELDRRRAALGRRHRGGMGRNARALSLGRALRDHRFREADHPSERRFAPQADDRGEPAHRPPSHHHPHPYAEVSRRARDHARGGQGGGRNARRCPRRDRRGRAGV